MLKQRPRLASRPQEPGQPLSGPPPPSRVPAAAPPVFPAVGHLTPQGAFPSGPPHHTSNLPSPCVLTLGRSWLRTSLPSACE